MKIFARDKRVIGFVIAEKSEDNRLAFAARGQKLAYEQNLFGQYSIMAKPDRDKGKRAKKDVEAKNDIVKPVARLDPHLTELFNSSV